MARTTIFLAALLLCVVAAQAQDGSTFTKNACKKNKCTVNNAAAGTAAITCGLSANGNVVALGTTTCSTPATTSTVRTAGAITTVRVYKARKAGASASTFGKGIARIEFVTANGQVATCGTGVTKGSAWTYFSRVAGSPNLASISGRCTGQKASAAADASWNFGGNSASGLSFLGLSLTFTSQGVGPTPGPSPSPKASPSPVPSASPAVFSPPPPVYNRPPPPPYGATGH